MTADVNGAARCEADALTGLADVRVRGDIDVAKSERIADVDAARGREVRQLSVGEFEALGCVLDADGAALGRSKRYEGCAGIDGTDQVDILRGDDGRIAAGAHRGGGIILNIVAAAGVVGV